MNEDANKPAELLGGREKAILTIIFLASGCYLILGSFGITDTGKLSANIPDWLIAVIGGMLLLLGLMIVLGDSGRINDLLAGLVISGMATIFGWISLFGDSANFSGDGALIADFTSFPLQRAIFGLGAIFCLLGAGYAFYRARTRKVKRSLNRDN